MPELRIDPLTGLRAIIAGERASRPGAFSSKIEAPRELDPDTDPFAEGNEDKTPPEVWALRPGGGEPDTPGWKVRVVPNLYPALGSGEEADSVEDPLGSGRGMPQMFASRPAVGAHEVIVNSPRAVTRLVDLEPDELETAMDAWRTRIRANDGAAYTHLIVNEGVQAGASLPHTHSQLYALPFVPAAVARERERFTAYFERTQGRNLLADLLQEEVRLRDRIVAIDSEAVVICPFASRMPFEMMLIPRSPRARFQDDGPLGAKLLHEALSRLQSTLGGLPPLNMWVRTAPSGAGEFCWHLDVVPRLAQLAGLEMGTGVSLNIVPPETAATQLRDAT
ncbi:MAG: UDPglucose--hexose-phosphate uridylyltransferase [Thermoleophilaceae bacterium]|nr:UDPglucose--hexose-phosphate uridylyltransferase [Thermoleophilaceae bacterium]